MNVFQNCSNTSDVIPLYIPQQLYLKPIAKIHITIHLPQYKIMGKTISHWEVMEKLRSFVSPDEFTALKVLKTTREFIQFEGEVEHKNKIKKFVEKLDKKMVKLSEINNLLQIRATEAKSNFPNKHSWDSYFRDAKDVDETKPGERPDTIYMSNLPIRWFVSRHLQNENDVKPSEKILFRIFEKFGKIRNVDIPICDPFRNKMKSYMTGIQNHSFEEKEFFEGYVQFKDYIGFLNAMDALRGMKLVYKNRDNYSAIDITIDFDKSKHLSDAAIKRREIVRDRLISKEQKKRQKEDEIKQAELKKIQIQSEKEVVLKKEKEKRRREREEKRKAKLLAELKLKESDDINEKIAKEEKKLLKVQRKLEAIRIIEELFKRIKDKNEQDVTPSIKLRSNEEEIIKFKKSSEMDVAKQREILHYAIENRVLLKTIIKKNIKTHKDSESDSDTDAETETTVKETETSEAPKEPQFPDYSMNSWYNIPFLNGVYPYHLGPMYPRGGPHISYNPPYYRGKGRNSSMNRGGPYYKRGRGNYNPRYRTKGRGNVNNYPPELQEEYYRYFQKFLNEDEEHHQSRSRTYSRSKSRSRSYSRPRSSGRRSRSHSRHRSTSKRTRSDRSYSRSRRSYTRSRTRSRTRSKSREARSYTRSRSKSTVRTNKSRDKSRSPRNRSCTPRDKSHTPRDKSRSPRDKSRSPRDKSRSPSYKSVDSSKFISPTELKRNRSH